MAQLWDVRHREAHSQNVDDFIRDGVLFFGGHVAGELLHEFVEEHKHWQVDAK